MQLIYADFFELVESLRGTKQSREIKQVKRVKTSVIASFLAKTYGMKIIFSNKPIAYSLALIEAKILLCLVFSTRHRRIVADSRNPCLLIKPILSLLKKTFLFAQSMQSISHCGQ